MWAKDECYSHFHNETADIWSANLATQHRPGAKSFIWASIAACIWCNVFSTWQFRDLERKEIKLCEEKMKYVSWAKYQKHKNWVIMIKQNTDGWLAHIDEESRDKKWLQNK